MAPIVSHPFRLTAVGFVATTEQTSNQATTEQIASLALTRRGELPMVPGFGLTDPAFRGVDVGELVAGITAYGPPAKIVDVAAVPGPLPGQQSVTIDYRR